MRWIYILCIIAAGVIAEESLERVRRAPGRKCPRIKNFSGRVKYKRRGSRAQFRCQRTFIRYGNKVVNCRQDNTWSGEPPICIKAGCVPVNIQHLEKLDMTELYGGALLSFTCEDDYQLIGATEMYCDSSVWSSTPPVCKAPIQLTECDFEDDLCGWTQDDSDDLDWAKMQGQTSTGGTGPKTDHTLKDISGHYMFVESSNPARNGDQARLLSPSYPSDMGDMCFEFWYHILGPDDPGHVGSLEVFVRGDSEFIDDLQPVYVKEGNQGDVWKRGEIYIDKRDEPYQIAIVVTRKLSYISDIAIDDVRLYNCSGTTSTTTVTTTSSSSVTSTSSEMTAAPSFLPSAASSQSSETGNVSSTASAKFLSSTTSGSSLRSSSSYISSSHWPTQETPRLKSSTVTNKLASATSTIASPSKSSTIFSPSSSVMTESRTPTKTSEISSTKIKVSSLSSTSTTISTGTATTSRKPPIKTSKISSTTTAVSPVISSSTIGSTEALKSSSKSFTTPSITSSRTTKVPVTTKIQRTSSSASASSTMTTGQLSTSSVKTSTTSTTQISTKPSTTQTTIQTTSTTAPTTSTTKLTTSTIASTTSTAKSALSTTKPTTSTTKWKTSTTKQMKSSALSSTMKLTSTTQPSTSTPSASTSTSLSTTMKLPTTSTTISRTTSKSSSAATSEIYSKTSSQMDKTETAKKHMSKTFSTKTITTAVKMNKTVSTESKSTSGDNATVSVVGVKTARASHPADETLKPLMIGLGVGIIAGLIIIGVVAWVCVRRRKFYTSRYEDELKPITKSSSNDNFTNIQYEYHDDEEYQ